MSSAVGTTKTPGRRSHLARNRSQWQLLASLGHLERLPEAAVQGQIVAGSAVVEDEEISRGGLVVEGAWQFCRRTGGQPLLWLGRRVKGGRGEGSSGLAWDLTEPPPTS